jgi:peptidoglycan/xylan/chitin deacetylase (PgdA/CDA1 family)
MRASTSKPGSRHRPAAAAGAGAGIAVLGFHRVGGPPAGSWETWYLVREDAFRAHLDYLDDEGWVFIALRDLVAALDGRAELPARSALVTFDDGYRATGHAALRVLGERGVPAVFFVPTDHVGDTNAFEADTAEPPEPICGWDELRRLEEAGISVESHGASHAALSGLDPDERDDELRRSKAALEAALGKRVDAVAYPYGDAGGTAASTLADLGYRVAFGYGGGPFTLGAVDRFHLPRIALGSDTDLARELAAQ